MWSMGATLVELNEGSHFHCIESKMLLDLKTFHVDPSFCPVSLIEFLHFRPRRLLRDPPMSLLNLITFSSLLAPFKTLLSRLRARKISSN